MKNIRKIARGIFTILLGLAVGSGHAFAAGDTWEFKASLPTSGLGQTVGVIDGKLFAPGLDPSSSYASSLEVYDPVTDSWDSSRTPSPTKRDYGASGVIGRKLYLAGGGCLAYGDPPDCEIDATNLLEVYDPDSDTWTTLTPMPTPRALTTGAVIDGKLYVVGGSPANPAFEPPLDVLEVYDPVTDTWATLAPMPTAREFMNAAVIDGKLYVVGGFLRPGTTGKLEVYDPATDTWDTTRAPMPTDRRDFAVGVIDGKLYAAGGFNLDGGVLPTLEVYDPVTDTWVTKMPMTVARSGVGGAVIGDKFYAVGGYYTGQVLEVYTPGAGNEPPVAEAGPNQSIHVGQKVFLDGRGSTDDNTASEDLGYAWIFSATPAGSTAVLYFADTYKPWFFADLPGDYVISLVVTDVSGLSSAADTVTVSSLNAPPTADAGVDRGSYVGNTVVLDGSASSDPDFDPITYAWTFSSRPVGSGAVLSGANSATPSFIADLAGTYVAQLIVSDRYADSTPDEVNIAVISPEQFAEGQVVEALNIVSTLPAGSTTTTGNQTALGNFLLQVIEDLQKDDVEKARVKLESAIERTDGCALRGSPDTGGDDNPLAKDYVTNCVDQAEIYPLLIDALNALTP